jgi:hypothetical protein
MSHESMPRNRAEVIGHVFDIDSVRRLLHPSGYSVSKEDDGSWYLGGGELDELEDSNSVRDFATQLLELANGVLLASTAGFARVEVGPHVQVGATKNVVLSIDSAVIRSRAWTATVTVTGQETPNDSVEPFSRERAWLDLSRLDPVVKAALYVLSSDIDNKFYRIFERIRKDVGGDENVRQMMSWSQSNLSKLTATLNSVRHEHPPPGPRVLMAEAETMTRDLLATWLDRKYSELK